jgi:hypothetical protein
MPSVCLMEALSAFEDEEKRHNRWFDSIGQQAREIKRNVISSLIPSLANHLVQGQAEGEKLFKEYEARLFHALDVLGSTAELIHPSPEILASSRSNPPIKDPTDNLILASILDHSKNYPSETKIFLSENRRDFDINSDARSALQDSGIGYFADASKFLDWHRVQPVP